jgi:hypothetical protein
VTCGEGERRDSLLNGMTSVLWAGGATDRCTSAGAGIELAALGQADRVPVGLGWAGAGSSLHFNGTSGGRAVTQENAPPGTLVVRGRDWKYDDQVRARRRRSESVMSHRCGGSVGSGVQNQIIDGWPNQ